MKKVSVKRGVSLLLTFVMVFSLLPALPAAAADAEYVAPTFYDDADDLASKTQSDSNYKGSLVVNRTKEGDYEVLRLGLYKTGALDTVAFNLAFDSDVVTLLNASTKSAIIGSAGPGGNYSEPTALAKSRALNFLSYTGSEATTGNEDYVKGNRIVTDEDRSDYAVFGAFNSGTVAMGYKNNAEGKSNAQQGGNFGFSLNTVNAGGTWATSEYMKIVDPSSTSNAKYINLKSYDEVFYIAELYFSVNEGKQVAADTFDVLPNGTSGTGGYVMKATGSDSGYVTYHMAFLGFNDLPASYSVSLVDESGGAIAAITSASFTPDGGSAVTIAASSLNDGTLTFTASASKGTLKITADGKKDSTTELTFSGGKVATVDGVSVTDENPAKIVLQAIPAYPEYTVTGPNGTALTDAQKGNLSGSLTIGSTTRTLTDGKFAAITDGGSTAKLTLTYSGTDLYALDSEQTLSISAENGVGTITGFANGGVATVAFYNSGDTHQIRLSPVPTYTVTVPEGATLTVVKAQAGDTYPILGAKDGNSYTVTSPSSFKVRVTKDNFYTLEETVTLEDDGSVTTSISASDGHGSIAGSGTTATVTLVAWPQYTVTIAAKEGGSIDTPSIAFQKADGTEVASANETTLTFQTDLEAGKIVTGGTNGEADATKLLRYGRTLDVTLNGSTKKVTLTNAVEGVEIDDNNAITITGIARPTYTFHFKDESGNNLAGPTIATSSGVSIEGTGTANPYFTTDNDVNVNSYEFTVTAPTGYYVKDTNQSETATVKFTTKATGDDQTVTFAEKTQSNVSFTFKTNNGSRLTSVTIDGEDVDYTNGYTDTIPVVNGKSVTITAKSQDDEHTYTYSGTQTLNKDGGEITLNMSNPVDRPIVQVTLTVTLAAEPDKTESSASRAPKKAAALPPAASENPLNVVATLTSSADDRSAEAKQVVLSKYEDDGNNGGTATLVMNVLEDVDYDLNITASKHKAISTTLAARNNTVTVGTASGSYTSGANATANVTLAPAAGESAAMPYLSDPVYTVTETVESPYSEMKAEVKLENVSATSGVFGMYFDNEVFDAPSVTIASGFTITDVKMASGAADIGAKYVLFGWTVDSTAANGMPTSESGTVIANITLPIKSTYRSEEALKKVIDNETLYTQDFAETTSATNIGANYDEAVKSIWRETGKEGYEDTVKIEDESLAKRGGFYQVAVPGTDAEKHPVYYDARMEFVLPDIAEKDKYRANFLVKDPSDKGVKDITVKVYSDAEKTTLIGEDKTDDDGYAHVAVSALGTPYYYEVVDEGDRYWIYPNGDVNTATDEWDVEEFTLGQDDAIEMGTPAGAGNKAAETGKGYIMPVVHAKTKHIVSVEGEDAKNVINITGGLDPDVAYNNSNYFFLLEPVAGRTWTESTMADVAAKLTVDLYEATTNGVADVTDAKDKEEKAYHTEKLTTPELKVEWDAASGKFKIAVGEAGSPLGDSLPEGLTDKLRAGDIVINVPTGATKAAAYTVTATAGEGGDVTAEGGNTPTKNDKTYTETLPAGTTTSATYTFTPGTTGETKNKISKVLINGVDQTDSLTEDQKANGYSYQFTNVSEDQSIYVMFETAEGEKLSDPAVSVSVGLNGSAEVKQDSTSKGVVPEDTEKTFSVEASKDVTVEIKPTDPDAFEIDKVLVTRNDGEAEDRAAAVKAADNKLTLTGLAKGDAVSVVITFKPKDSETSTQVIVTPVIKAGFGTISPSKATVYPVNTKPQYSIEPLTNWKVGKILVGGDDVTSDYDADAETLVLPNLTEDVTLEVTFVEVTHKVKGQIKLEAAVGKDVVPATVTFTREAGNGLDKYEESVGSDKTVATSQLVGFEKDLPAGTYTVTVEKRGYLTYTISEFVVYANETEDINFGRVYNDNAKKDAITIELIGGNAYTEDQAINYRDPSVVVAGWVEEPLKINATDGDLDESGTVNTEDMGIVQNNMWRTAEKDCTMTYDVFVNPPATP